MLQEADAAGQCVVVCGHLPVFPGTCPPACLLWNYEEVLSTLQRYARAGVVVATMAGHTHQVRG
jgi:manganese-dependent ADP-ribose/CDP-alcohol diphosphatase